MTISFAFLEEIFSGLKDRSYRNYFFAVMLSLTGVGFFLYTQGWYILHLTGNKLSVGLSWSIFFTPGLLFLPIVGRLLDIASVKKLLAILEFSKAGILLVFIPILYFFPSVFLVYLLSGLFGIFFVVFIPSIFVVLKKIIKEQYLAKESHLLEIALQIGSSLAIFCSGYLYQQLNFLVLIGIGGLLIALSGKLMLRVTIVSNIKTQPFSPFKEYKKFFNSIFEIIGQGKQNRKIYLFGMLHQLPQNIVLALNIPLLLYVYEAMQKGPFEYGMLDSLIGIVAMFTGLFWTRYYLKGQEKFLVIIMPFCAALIFIGVVLFPAIGITPYVIFAILAIFLTSSKVQCRAAVLKKTPIAIIGQLTAFYQVGNYLILLLLTFALSYLCQHVNAQLVFLLISAVMFGFSWFLVWAYTGE